jgi:hypothetical protein
MSVRRPDPGDDPASDPLSDRGTVDALARAYAKNVELYCESMHAAITARTVDCACPKIRAEVFVCRRPSSSGLGGFAIDGSSVCVGDAELNANLIAYAEPCTGRIECACKRARSLLESAVCDCYAESSGACSFGSFPDTAIHASDLHDTVRSRAVADCEGLTVCACAEAALCVSEIRPFDTARIFSYRNEDRASVGPYCRARGCAKSGHCFCSRALGCCGTVVVPAVVERSCLASFDAARISSAVELAVQGPEVILD